MHVRMAVAKAYLAAISSALPSLTSMHHATMCRTYQHLAVDASAQHVQLISLLLVWTIVHRLSSHLTSNYQQVIVITSNSNSNSSYQQAMHRLTQGTGLFATLFAVCNTAAHAVP
jgi:hypothetical protein